MLVEKEEGEGVWWVWERGLGDRLGGIWFGTLRCIFEKGRWGIRLRKVWVGCGVRVVALWSA